MKLDRYTARALVDANLMSLREYIDKFGIGAERDAGRADRLYLVRVRPQNRTAKERLPQPRYGAARNKADLTLTGFLCH